MKHLPCFITGLLGALIFVAILSIFNAHHRYEKHHEAYLLHECYLVAHGKDYGPVTKKEMEELDENCTGAK